MATADATLGLDESASDRTHIGLTSFKLLDAYVAWSSTLVLFGRNDAGKSNLLEAVTALLSGASDTEGIRQPGHAGAALARNAASVSGEVLVEFDSVRDENNLDARFLKELIQFRPPRVVFRELIFEGRVEANRIYLAESGFRSWEDDPTDVADQWISIGAEPQSLSVIRERLRSRLIQIVGEPCDEWTRMVADVETLIGACLDSREFYFVVDTTDEARVAWLAPARRHLSDDVLAAAHRVKAAEARWSTDVPVLGRWLDSLVGTGDDLVLPRARDRVFLYLNSLQELALFEVVQITNTGASLDAVVSEITRRLERLLREVLTINEIVAEALGAFCHYDHGSVVSEEPWLLYEDENVFRIHPLLQAFCRRLGLMATEASPSFVSDRYCIEVVPITPHHWRVVGDQRVVILLRNLSDGVAYELPTVASGIAVWTAYSLARAMGTMEAEIQKLWRGDTSSDVLTALNELVDDDEIDLISDIPAQPPARNIDVDREDEPLRIPPQMLFMLR